MTNIIRFPGSRLHHREFQFTCHKDEGKEILHRLAEFFQKSQELKDFGILDVSFGELNPEDLEPGELPVFYIEFAFPVSADRQKRLTQENGWDRALEWAKEKIEEKWNHWYEAGGYLIRHTPSKTICNGSCEPMCDWCNEQADIAAECNAEFPNGVY